MSATTTARVLAALSARQGHANGITARDLALLLRISERDVRHAVSELRAEGVAVCGHPRDGYFVATTPEELEETCQFLRGRAMHSLLLEARLRKVPLPDLLGQLRLKT